MVKRMANNTGFKELVFFIEICLIILYNTFRRGNEARNNLERNKMARKKEESKLTIDSLASEYPVFTYSHKLAIDIDCGSIECIELDEDSELTSKVTNIQVNSYSAERMAIIFSEMAIIQKAKEAKKIRERAKAYKAAIAKDKEKEKKKAAKKKTTKKKVTKKAATKKAAKKEEKKAA